MNFIIAYAIFDYEMPHVRFGIRIPTLNLTISICLKDEALCKIKRLQRSEKAIEIFELTLLVFYTVSNCTNTDPLLID